MNTQKALLQMKSKSSPSRRKSNLRFFKTSLGEYGEGDQFLGVSVPDTRAVAKNFYHLNPSEILTLLKSPLHEVRLLALLIWVHQFEEALKRKESQKAEKIYRLYLRNTQKINNWDLVDQSAPPIVGAFLFENPSELQILQELSRSKNLWKRRIAIVSTLYLIRKGQLQTTLEISKKLLNDPEDLVHKATGWMLREVGKKDETVLIDYLKQWSTKLPRTTLRYAIERLSPTQKKYFMSL